MKKLIALALLLGCGAAQAATIVVDVVDSMTINITLIGPLRGPAPLEPNNWLRIDIPALGNVQAFAWPSGTASIGNDRLWAVYSGWGPGAGLVLGLQESAVLEVGDLLSGTSSLAFDKEHGITQDMFDNGAPIYWGDTTFQGNAISGKVSAIPIPAAVWLFASGLGLLGWFRRRQSATFGAQT